jgi:hypothetical protein
MNSPPKTNPPVPKGPRRVDLWSADILSALGDVALSGRKSGQDVRASDPSIVPIGGFDLLIPRRMTISCKQPPPNRSFDLP